ncbi:streptothricin acetyltransferase Sat-1 [Cytobacillus firmus DS1]|uniref:Streptothricin acetyltransferase Sat-1 n=1 Tax=Cytobacillus firmus DS1 TaxID=1307436 RepID=W7LL91_CYTFI|nr:streptothricin acetyltransferase Sat-1 [Cytobacillus firmus DS1]
MSEQIMKINNVDICTESFGNSKDPAILLIIGKMSSLDWRDEGPCY